MESLENHAYIIKGHLLSTAAPPPIMDSMNALITAITYKPKESAIDWDKVQMNVSQSIVSMDAVHHKTIPDVPAAILRKKTKKRLDPIIDLPAIQKAHNALESNVVIGKRHNVSDQTIINFLTRYGKYTSRKHEYTRKAVKPAPEPITVAAQPQREDMLGEPLISVPYVAPARKYVPQRDPLSPRLTSDTSKQSKWLKDRYDGKVTAGDLMDIHDMLSAGKTLDDIAEHYHTERKIIEIFILDNRNAQLTKVKAGYNPNLLLK